jgi:hypothetical protein
VQVFFDPQMFVFEIGLVVKQWFVNTVFLRQTITAVGTALAFGKSISYLMLYEDFLKTSL